MNFFLIEHIIIIYYKLFEMLVMNERNRRKKINGNEFYKEKKNKFKGSIIKWKQQIWIVGHYLDIVDWLLLWIICYYNCSKMVIEFFSGIWVYIYRNSYNIKTRPHTNGKLHRSLQSRIKSLESTEPGV